jgi:hypothetical protein
MSSISSIFSSKRDRSFGRKRGRSGNNSLGSSSGSNIYGANNIGSKDLSSVDSSLMNNHTNSSIFTSLRFTISSVSYFEPRLVGDPTVESAVIYVS